MSQLADIQTYRKMLYVHRHRLDDELEIQADIMERISSQTVIQNSRQLDAKDQLSRIEARLVEDAKEDDPKLSNPMAEARVRRDPERIKAWQAYQAARAEHEAWQGLLDAWKQRGYAIKTLADLYAANYYSPSSTVRKEAVSDADNLRAQMRAAGRRPVAEERTAAPDDDVAPRRTTRRTLV